MKMTKAAVSWQRYVAVITGILFMAVNGMAQSGNSSIEANMPRLTPPSPNAASLGQYGQIPVSPFSGLAQIGIPLGSAPLDETTLDISLNYHGGGIHPDEHPGWVGLGWDLNAGGVITRRINGRKDEFLADNPSITNKLSYYDNYSVGNTPDWASAASLQRDMTVDDVLEPSPDEFVFNFGKYSGSFFLDHTGKWQVRSETPLTLKIQEELKDNYLLNGQGSAADLTLRRIFYKFTVYTPDGVQYVFGGDTSSIEFTRNADANTDDVYHNNIQATSWYLTKIISTNGREIDFTYRHLGIIATVSANGMIYHYQVSGQFPTDSQDPLIKTLSIINPVYLTAISTPTQQINFSQSVSNELKYDYLTLFNLAAEYHDLSVHRTGQEAKGNVSWKKLDSISFYSNTGQFLRKVAFTYIENATTRLMLSKIQEIGSDGSTKPPYSFTYDPTPLPPYNSGMLDHWGFYNGRYFFGEHAVTYPYSHADIQPYIDSRASNLTLMRAGILTGITYPTGGSTNFEYEPHDYSQVAQRFPFVVVPAGGNIQCGGLRIKKITDVDNIGNVQNTKEYIYTLNYNAKDGSNVSSGILSGQPQYVDEGSITGAVSNYWFWYSYTVEPLSATNGNHVTYSQVVEKQSDGGYTIYNFSNHDLGQYRDQPPVSGLYTATGQWRFDENISLALDRGKMLEKREFNAGNILLHDVRYTYDESAARLNEATRIVQLGHRNFGSGPTGAIDLRATAYLIYTFPRLLTKETDIMYDQFGANPVTTEKNFAYNSHRLKQSESFVNSTGQTLTTYYRYPFDVYTLPVTGMPNNHSQLPFMLARNMIDQPLEMIKTKVIGGVEKVIDANVNDMNRFWNTVHVNDKWSFLTATSVNKSSYINYTITGYDDDVEISQKDPHLERRIANIIYDEPGNVIGYIEDNVTHGFVWGYNDHYLIAEVVNGDGLSIAYTSFESPGETEPGWVVPSPLRNTAKILTGKQSFDMVNAGTTGITINNFGNNVVSYWTTNTTPYTIAGTQGTPLKGRKIGEWTYFEHHISGEMQVKITGTGLIEDLRYFPEGTTMKTYTYNPPIGMTNMCGPQDQVYFYEYDAFQRLKFIRDQDGRIIKLIDYKYQTTTP